MLEACCCNPAWALGAVGGVDYGRSQQRQVPHAPRSSPALRLALLLALNPFLVLDCSYFAYDFSFVWWCILIVAACECAEQRRMLVVALDGMRWLHACFRCGAAAPLTPLLGVLRPLLQMPSSSGLAPPPSCATSASSAGSCPCSAVQCAPAVQYNVPLQCSTMCPCSAVQCALGSCHRRRRPWPTYSSLAPPFTLPSQERAMPLDCR